MKYVNNYIKLNNKIIIYTSKYNKYIDKVIYISKLIFS